MCGIVGFSKYSQDAGEILREMLKPIQHRGPDATNTHIASNIALGHQRLIVIEPEGGEQPRVDTETNNALVFNGEIYGYKKHIEELNKLNIKLNDNSDTEVLFQYLQKYGVESTLEKINGMFAFAYFDAIKKNLFLVRDRFGEKPLYYGISQGVLVFGSELQSVRKHPLFKNAELNFNAISEYLHFDYIPNEGTLYKNIYKLRPGNYLTWNNGAVRIQSYWKPQHDILNSGKNINENECIEQLENILSESIKQCLVADVPVAVFLSGGVDSALIAALASRHNSNIHSYTVKMPSYTYDESADAKATADHLGISHEIIELGDYDLIAAFDHVFSKLDEVLADSSLIPTYLISREVRKKATVALGGDGADELFAGYMNFSVQKWSRLFSMLPKSIGQLLAQVVRLMLVTGQYMSQDFLINQLSYGFGRKDYQQSFYWMASFPPASQSKLWSASVISEGFNSSVNSAVDKISKYGNKYSEDYITRLVFQFISSYLPDDILTKVDRASMYNSLEVRSPFLSKPVAEYALNLPSNMKIKNGCRKYILKRVAEKYLSKDIVNRKKHGFALPVSDLIKTKLKDRFEDVLFDANNPAAKLFNHSEVKRLWNEHQQNKVDHRKKLWSLYTLYKVLDNYSAIN